MICKSTLCHVKANTRCLLPDCGDMRALGCGKIRNMSDDNAEKRKHTHMLPQFLAEPPPLRIAHSRQAIQHKIVHRGCLAPPDDIIGVNPPKNAPGILHLALATLSGQRQYFCTYATMCTTFRSRDTGVNVPCVRFFLRCAWSRRYQELSVADRKKHMMMILIVR